MTVMLGTKGFVTVLVALKRVVISKAPTAVSSGLKNSQS